MEFPHMKDTAFPHLNNVDVFKYQNEFDYSRFDEMQMQLQLCTVPWDMGEAHIGNRTISGIGNVVWFETEENRDAWFDKIPDSECYRFDSKYKALHRDNEIIIPVPFEVASLYNYLVVDYEPFASEGDYVQYESPNGLRRWFWFIREVEFLAPNSTRLHLMNDAFQTFMYRMNFSGMVLERGHAPMFANSIDNYLSNPIQNSMGLLCEDVNYGQLPNIVVQSKAYIFNSDAWACIACTSSPSSTWGSKANNDWNTPALSSYTVDGVPNYRIFCIDVSQLNVFLGAIDNQTPQFKQSIKGVFFAPKELITIGASFTFGGVTCYWVSTTNHTVSFIDITKDRFGYSREYANIAKLYTYPYAAIEITDELGNVDIIKIEETGGKLDINESLSLAYPAISLQAHILGAGGISQTALTFSNITNRSLTIGGKWYETLHSWDVPIFGVIQSSALHNDYATHYDRQQQVTAYTNEYNSSVASADTTLTNAGNNADNLTNNAALQVASNSAMTAAGNTQASADTQTGQTLNTNTTNNAISYTNASSNNTIELKDATAAASQASNAVSAATGAVANGLTGNVPGAVSSVVSGITQAAVINATNEAGVNYTAAQAAASNTNNRSNAIDTNIAAYQTNEHAITAANTKRDAANALTTGAAANTAATTIENATNERNTQVANAGRTRDTAQNAISNQVKQAALNAPFEFGEFAHTEFATTKPITLLANFVTQAPGYVKLNGDEFLRYGYMFNAQWPFNGNWNIGKHFTYWKLSDFWVSGLNIPDMYVDKLRFFLYGGVTVWRKPEDIGNVTIYDNGI